MQPITATSAPGAPSLDVFVAKLDAAADRSKDEPAPEGPAWLCSSAHLKLRVEG